MKKSPEMPLWQSVFWIVGSAFLFAGVSHKVMHTYVFGKKQPKEVAQEHAVSYIVQTGLQKEALHSDYLAELLGLSKDSPVLFTHFQEEAAEKRLLFSPLFQKVAVKKIPPNMIYVDYAIRKPVGWAVDFANTAFDKDGYLFPMAPFFSPKKLPEIYLGSEGLEEAHQDKEPSFKTPLQGRLFDLAMQVLSLFEGWDKDYCMVKRIDVSQSFFPTLGKRGIVVVVENDLGGDPATTSTHFLRLSTKQFAKEIGNYQGLRAHLVETEKEKLALGEKIKEKIIDLRLSQLAFVE